MTKLTNNIHVLTTQVVSHRDGTFLAQLYVPAPLREIEGHQYVIGMTRGDDKWYIMPAENDKLDELEDIGPFDEFDDALLHFKLMSDTVR